MTIYILGLGLMGSAYAYKLIEKGWSVSGWDQDDAVRSFHQDKGFITLKPFSDEITADILVLALSPNATLSLFKKNPQLDKSFDLITDLSGLKGLLHTKENPLFEKDNYISHHPMTGFKLQGPSYYQNVIFEDKNVITIDKPYSVKAMSVLNTMINALGFTQTYVLNPINHDQVITLNSHIPHVLGSLLTRQKNFKEGFENAGNSFITLSGYAEMNASLWSELFHLNKDFLDASLSDWIESLKQFKLLLNSKEAIKDFLIQSDQELNNAKGS